MGIGKGGVYGNVHRIKPPYCLNKPDIDLIIEALEIGFEEL